MLSAKLVHRIEDHWEQVNAPVLPSDAEQSGHAALHDACQIPN